MKRSQKPIIFLLDISPYAITCVWDTRLLTWERQVRAGTGAPLQLWSKARDLIALLLHFSIVYGCIKIIESWSHNLWFVLRYVQESTGASWVHCGMSCSQALPNTVLHACLSMSVKRIVMSTQLILWWFFFLTWLDLLAYWEFGLRIVGFLTLFNQ